MIAGTSMRTEIGQVRFRVEIPLMLNSQCCRWGEAPHARMENCVTTGLRRRHQVDRTTTSANG